jgi:hypothetical protein
MITYSWSQIFCKEALVWRQLSHPHVLPFLGVDAEIFKATNFICMVSLWLSRGTLLEYVLGSGFDTKERERLVSDLPVMSAFSLMNISHS